jgi:hypothetical protein
VAARVDTGDGLVLATPGDPDGTEAQPATTTARAPITDSIAPLVR